MWRQPLDLDVLDLQLQFWPNAVQREKCLLFLQGQTWTVCVALHLWSIWGGQYYSPFVKKRRGTVFPPAAPKRMKEREGKRESESASLLTICVFMPLHVTVVQRLPNENSSTQSTAWDSSESTKCTNKIGPPALNEERKKGPLCLFISLASMNYLFLCSSSCSGHYLLHLPNWNVPSCFIALLSLCTAVAYCPPLAAPHTALTK